MSDVDDRTSGLPDGMADGLRELSLSRTAGTTPWPRVRTAVRRDRRRRVIGAGVAAAGLVVATIAAAGALLPNAVPPAPEGREPTPPPSVEETAPPRAVAPDADPALLGGPTAGSLASDKAWLAGLKQRAVQDSADSSEITGVRVLWATDRAGQRHALTVSHEDTEVSLLTLWRGEAGADPADMRVEERTPSVSRSDKPFVGSFVFQIRDGAPDRGPGVFVATGSGLMTVEASADAAYDVQGRRELTWRPLAPQGAVFVGEATELQLDDMVVRGARTDGRWFSLRGNASTSPIEASQPSPELLAVSPADVQKQALTCAARSFSAPRGGFPPSSEAVLGGTPRWGAFWVGIAVARAPDGAYLVGLCRTTDPAHSATTGNADQAEGFVVPAPESRDARDLLVLVPCGRTGGMEALVQAVCVIAPEGATEVEVGSVVAPVSDRLAIVEFPMPLPVDDLRATARIADGSVAGPVRRADGEAAVSELALPAYGSSVFP